MTSILMSSDGNQDRTRSSLRSSLSGLSLLGLTSAIVTPVATFISGARGPNCHAQSSVMRTLVSLSLFAEEDCRMAISTESFRERDLAGSHAIIAMGSCVPHQFLLLSFSWQGWDTHQLLPHHSRCSRSLLKTLKILEVVEIRLFAQSVLSS